MALLTVIGRGVRVRGRIHGEGDLTIGGHVEGEIVLAGELTVDAGGLVGANVSARAIVVHGAVRGDLTGEEVVRLEEGARVVGDIRAPRIAIAKGALVRGLVQTGALSAAAAPRASTQTRAAPASHAKAAAPKPAPAAAPARVSRPTPAAVVKQAPLPAAPAPRAAPVAQKAVTNHGAPPVAARPVTPSVLAGAAPAATAQRPPPPVIPALKKGAKAALKKKAT